MSLLWQNIIVVLIVAVSLLAVVRRFLPKSPNKRNADVSLSRLKKSAKDVRARTEGS